MYSETMLLIFLFATQRMQRVTIQNVPKGPYGNTLSSQLTTVNSVSTLYPQTLATI